MRPDSLRIRAIDATEMPTILTWFHINYGMVSHPICSLPIYVKSLYLV